MTPEARAEVRFPLDDDAPDFDNVLRQRGYFTAIREQVEPLEGWKESAIKVLGEWDKVHEALGKPGKLGESMAAASLAEVQKLRALVQELTNRLHKERLKYSDIVDMLNIDHGLLSAKEQGFVPTNTEDK